MISKLIPATTAYVWIWLPGQTEPVVAGIIEKQDNLHRFTYGKRYRELEQAIALSPFELPLQAGTFEPVGLNRIHSCLRDAAPDAWGRRVVSYEYPQLAADELDYMLLSGSNRIGALDFQISNSEYSPRVSYHAELEQLVNAAEYVEKGIPMPIELGNALLQGSSIGGARPKCLISDDKNEYIAKFSLSTDLYDIIKAEFVAMRLAKIANINVPEVYLKSVLGKNVLLIERFDRVKNEKKLKTRRYMLSGLSLLGLNEMEARYASYLDLADIIRQRFVNPKQELEELYKRLVFNILIGNTDDHARNISAFWDGFNLRLTPAYDLCPQYRAGQEATQAMAIEGEYHNYSTLKNVLSVSEKFLIDKEIAKNLINGYISIVDKHWNSLCDEAELPPIERQKLWKKSILNPYCLYDWDTERRILK